MLNQKDGSVDVGSAPRIITRVTRASYVELASYIESLEASSQRSSPYYLEKLYYQDQHQTNELKPLALLLHINSQTLLNDSNQEHWLHYITRHLGHDVYQAFAHWVIISQHTLFWSAGVEGSQDDTSSYSRYSGSYQRQLGCLLRDCGLQLSRWLVYVPQADITTVMSHYGHQDLPRLQMSWGRGGAYNLVKTMLPGLLYTHTGQGWASFCLEANGCMTLHYKVKKRADDEQSDFYRRYNADGQMMLKLGETPPVSQLNTRLFKKTRRSHLILQLISQLLAQSDVMDWRLLPWTILATTDWGKDVYKQRISPQLFQPLLAVIEKKPATAQYGLSPALIQTMLDGLQHCFDYYLDDDYQGYYSTLFRQLALWHQALSTLQQLFNRQHSLTGSSLLRSESRSQLLARKLALRNHFEQWLGGNNQVGYSDVETSQPDESDTHSESYSELSLPNQQPLHDNEFRGGLNVSQRLVDIEVNHCLDDLIIRPDLLRRRLLGGCLKALNKRFGDGWSYYAIHMSDYPEFAQTSFMMVLLQIDFTQALSSLFYKFSPLAGSMEGHWLSYMLESELIVCAEYDHANPGNPIFNATLHDYLSPYGSRQQKGQVLQQLALAKPSCWGHLLTDQGCFQLTRHPLVRQQMNQILGWQSPHELFQQNLVHYHQQLHSLASSWLSCLLSCFYSSHDSPQAILQAYYQDLQNSLHHDHSQQASHSFKFFEVELRVKRRLDKQRRQQPHQSLLQGLQDLTEWLCVATSEDERSTKWQMLQLIWPQEWQPHSATHSATTQLLPSKP